MKINPKSITSASDWKNYDTTRNEQRYWEKKITILACAAGMVTIVLCKSLELLWTNM